MMYEMDHDIWVPTDYEMVGPMIRQAQATPIIIVPTPDAEDTQEFWSRCVGLYLNIARAGLTAARAQ
jgi:hypothetical protein